MKPIFCPLVVAVILAFCSNAAKAGSNPLDLFNGTNLEGWVPMSGGEYTVTNGVIHLEGGQGWLRTEKPYADFILTVEWRGLKGGYNSGVFLRASLAGKPWPTNIWQVNTKQTGIGELLAGSRKIIPSSIPPIPPGTWVAFRIEARGTNLSLAVNGRRTWEFHSLQPATGYLGLQAEGKAFEFRNLQIVALPPVVGRKPD
jgi:hypothetical protein